MESIVDERVIINRDYEQNGRKIYDFFRRFQDIFFSSLALIFLGPFMLIISFLIFLDDPAGSPIFSQKRCGKDGREFQLYKFRSMYVGAEEKLDELLEQNEMDGPAFKMQNDPRITRLGRIIRKGGIDELPQLWNIIKGDMSIVGPRPPIPREVAEYDDYQMQRLYITPGLTCYWQIQPKRNDLSFEEWMELDIKYIQERSFFVDWKIIFGTIGTVFRGEGK